MKSASLDPEFTEIMIFLQNNPAMGNARFIANALGRDPRRVSEALVALKNFGVVAKVGDGRHHFYRRNIT